MKKSDLTIYSDSVASIEASFDRIAEDLFTNWNLKVNDTNFSFTELEFYFFKDKIHEDTATHEHKYQEGRWRFHLQGMDITFPETNDSDGGILIRGIQSSTACINGPKRVLEEIFRQFLPVSETNNQFGLIPSEPPRIIPIFKTFRHGLSNSQGNEFKHKYYRYYTDIDNWEKKHVSESEKCKIRDRSQPLSLAK